MYEITKASENASTVTPPPPQQSGGGCTNCLGEAMCGIGLLIIGLFVMSFTGIGGISLDTSNPMLVVAVFGLAIFLIVGGLIIFKRKS